MSLLTSINLESIQQEMNIEDVGVQKATKAEVAFNTDKFMGKCTKAAAILNDFTKKVESHPELFEFAAAKDVTEKTLDPSDVAEGESVSSTNNSCQMDSDNESADDGDETMAPLIQIDEEADSVVIPGTGGTTMADLKALLNDIISTMQQVRSEQMLASIDVSVVMALTNIDIAGERINDIQVKARGSMVLDGINAVSQVVSIGAMGWSARGPSPNEYMSINKKLGRDGSNPDPDKQPFLKNSDVPADIMSAHMSDKKNQTIEFSRAGTQLVNSLTGIVKEGLEMHVNVEEQKLKMVAEIMEMVKTISQAMKQYADHVNETIRELLKVSLEVNRASLATNR